MTCSFVSHPSIIRSPKTCDKAIIYITCPAALELTCDYCLLGIQVRVKHCVRTEMWMNWSIYFSSWTFFLYSHFETGEAASFVDPTSVHLVEGLMPQTSLSDRRRIIGLVESHQIFALVTGVNEREALQDRLLSTPGRIISLNTLAQDSLFLEDPARALRCLCPQFTGSLRKVMLRQWNLGSQRTLEIQKSEHVFGTMQQSAESFSICMIQLWLFAFRHFIHQRSRTKTNRRHFRWSTEDHSLRKLADLADRLGFKSNEITALLQEDLYQNIAKGLIESL